VRCDVKGKNQEYIRQNLVSGIKGVAGGGGEELRPHLAAQFKGQPMGGKFSTLQETFGFQSETNLKLLTQIQQFLSRTLGGICFWAPTGNNYSFI